VIFGKPIIAQEVLEKYYPNAFTGLSRPSKSIRIKDTLIVFVDPSEQPQAVIENATAESAPAE